MPPIRELPAKVEVTPPRVEADAAALFLQLTSRAGDGTLTFTAPQIATIELSLPVNPQSPSIPILEFKGATLELTATLPQGFALTGATCPAGVSLVDLGNQRFALTAVGDAISGAVTCTFETINALGASVGTIVPVLAARNNLLLSTELGLDQQMDRFGDPGEGGSTFPKPSGLGGVGLPLTASEDGPASYAFATSLIATRSNLGAGEHASASAPYGLGARTSRAPSPSSPGSFNMWAEGYVAAFDDGSAASASDGRMGVIYVGADYLATPDLLIGALVQYDDSRRDFDSSPTETRDRGWMAGPYAMLRLPSSTFLQVRAAWGTSDNEIRYDSTFRDEYDTDRWLVRGTLISCFRYGAWQVKPRASVGYIEENQKAYTNSFGVAVPHEKVSLGQAKFGSEFAYEHRISSSTVVVPSLLLEGIWNFDQSNGELTLDDLVTNDGLRGRTELGVMLIASSGASLGAAVTYDGIGSDDFHAFGGRLRAKVPLN